MLDDARGLTISAQSFRIKLLWGQGCRLRWNFIVTVQKNIKNLEPLTNSNTSITLCNNDDLIPFMSHPVITVSNLTFWD